MKLLVLLAVLGAVSAQYRLYTGVSPYYNGYNTPLTYAAHPLTHAAHPFYYGALPYSFKPAEEKVSEGKPVVESRSKRSAEEVQKADDATFVTTYATHNLPYTAGFPFAHTAYAAPTVYSAGYGGYNALPYSYGYHGYTPLVHSLKKRDTSAAEDQKAEDATFVSTYAARLLPLAYTAGFPHTYNGYTAPTVYNAAPATYSGFPYNYPITYRTVY